MATTAIDPDWIDAEPLKIVDSEWSLVNDSKKV